MSSKIFEKIILPLTDRWSHPSVLSPIKYIIKAFIPEVNNSLNHNYLPFLKPNSQTPL
jgi:hypothetical protein